MSESRRAAHLCEACALGAAASPTTAKPKPFRATVEVARGADEALEVLSRFLDSDNAHATIERTGSLVFVRVASRQAKPDDE